MTGMRRDGKGWGRGATSEGKIPKMPLTMDIPFDSVKTERRRMVMEKIDVFQKDTEDDIRETSQVQEEEWDCWIEGGWNQF